MYMKLSFLQVKRPVAAELLNDIMIFNIKSERTWAIHMWKLNSKFKSLGKLESSG